jgi:hypothetical protein
MVPNGGIYPTVTNGDESECICTLADTGDVMEANARLIAAAPDMLAALREIAVYPDHRHSCPGDAFMAISNIAKVAIQAAEGRA